MSREKLEIFAAKILKVVGIVFFAVMAIFPFYWMVVLSFRPLDEVLQDPLRMFPTWENIRTLSTYRGVLFEQHFTLYIRNSTVVALVTTALTVGLAILGAYAVARLKFPGRNVMSFGIILIYMFPAIMLAIPLFVIFSRLGLRGSLPGLIIVYMAQTIPVALYMLRSYFETIPKDLEEAALIDGCNRFEVIWRITIPLAVPAIAAVSLYVFMIAWNEFLFALLFLLDKPEVWTLSLGVQQLDTQEVPKTWLMAGSVIISVPVVVLFSFFERFLTRGLTAGAVGKWEVESGRWWCPLTGGMRPGGRRGRRMPSTTIRCRWMPHLPWGGCWIAWPGAKGSSMCWCWWHPPARSWPRGPGSVWGAS